ncbi:MAG TPA: MlaD family protein [Gemmatimonadaceae bacterium]|nr:MlaD family protein [Gemmatimonadaceae bacterium]
MASPHRPGWPDLKLGIVAVLTVIAIALSILIFGRVGTLHGKKFTLYVTTDEARGVIRGTEVWLDGQRVGTVKSVDFRPPTVGVKDRLILSLSMLESSRSHIRSNTRVQVRAGGTIIGDQVVYMTSGTTRAAGVSDGDTIRAGEQADFESVSSDAAGAGRELPAILENVKLLTAQLQTTEGTLGALGLESGTTMRSVHGKTARLMARLSNGRGTIPMALSATDALRARASRAMAQADSIRALVASDQHSLGRFRRDSTLLHSIGEVRAELEHVQTLAASPDGTIGRFRTDSALTHAMHRDLAALDSLFADIKKHPLRYIAF